MFVETTGGMSCLVSLVVTLAAIEISVLFQSCRKHAESVVAKQLGTYVFLYPFSQEMFGS